jgi:DNA-binding transcriptional LysR family regulator
MNLKQFEALYWVARLGGFHAAARHLKTTQPAISARIRGLERSLGVEVFDRSRRNARITAKGRELVAYAERLMQIGSEIQQRVGTRNALSGRVRLGVTSVPAATWLPELMRRLALAYPGVVVEFCVDASESMRERLLAGELDVAILSAALPLGAKLAAERIGRVELAWLAAPALGLPAGRIDPAALAASPVISDAPGSQLRAVADRWFRRGGIEPREHHACSSLVARIRLATEGMGVALATPAAAAREISEGTLRVLGADPALPSLEYILASSGPRLSPSVKIVSTLVKELITERPGIQFFYSQASRPAKAASAIG